MTLGNRENVDLCQSHFPSLCEVEDSAWAGDLGICLDSGGMISLDPGEGYRESYRCQIQSRACEACAFYVCYMSI